MVETAVSRVDITRITESVFSKHDEFQKGYRDVESSKRKPRKKSVAFSELPDSAEPDQGLLDIPYKLLRLVPFVSGLLPSVDPKREQIQHLLHQQKLATNYRSWYAICLRLDSLLNNDAWKLDPKLDLYDYELVRQNYEQLQQARLNKDYKLVLYLVRTTWIRNVGNMGNVNLYRHSYVGTKRLIEDYIQECELALEYLLNDPSVELDSKYLLGMLVQTRKNIGRTALVLLGGSTFGIFHIGVLATLLENNLLPRIVSGSSAGSIMASILCCCTNEETVELIDTISERKFEIFGNDNNIDASEKGSGIRKNLDKLAHFLKYGTFFDILGLKETMIGFVGDLTFREAYNRTGKILNITVSPALIHEQTKLLNYLTAPNCLIWSAVCASCSLPGIFPTSSIYEKSSRGYIQEWNNDTSVKYMDGSVDGDLPITRLLEMFNVDHIIACQVNPHVVPFLKMSVTCVGGEIENEFSSKLKNCLTNIYDFMSGEVIHYLEVMNEAGVGLNLTTKMISILSQQYSGDITIMPDFYVKDFTKIFENPTPQFLLEYIVRGARASWPKITVIKNHCWVEFALDKAITQLRGKIITSRREKGHPPLAPNNVSMATSLASIGSTSGSGIDSLVLGGLLKRSNLNSDFSLISSPILSLDASKSPSPSYTTKVSPTLRSHKTIGAGTCEHLVEPHLPSQQESRQSFSATSDTKPSDSGADENGSTKQQVDPCFPSTTKLRGKSTTSLVEMSKMTNDKPKKRAKKKSSKAFLNAGNSNSQQRPNFNNPLYLHGRSKSYYSPDIDKDTSSVKNSQNFHSVHNFQNLQASTDQNMYRNESQDLELQLYYPKQITPTNSENVPQPEVGLGVRDGQTSPIVSKAVRKSKSSGNFYATSFNPNDNIINGFENSNNDEGASRKLKYEAERIPYYQGNPYLDPPVYAAASSLAHQAQAPAHSHVPQHTPHQQTSFALSPSTRGISKRVAGTHSMRNSYVGLNSLKDNSGPLLTLKDLPNGESQIQKMKHLTSPDIRRSSFKATSKGPLSRQNSDGFSILVHKLTLEQQTNEAKSARKAEPAPAAPEPEDKAPEGCHVESGALGDEESGALGDEEEDTVVDEDDRLYAVDKD